MSRQPKTWFVVADGAHLRILVRDGDGFAAVTASSSADAHHASSDLGSDRPGRSFEGGGTAHHAIEPHSDPHLRAKRGFAHSVADAVNDGLHRHAFVQWVLVAPPKTMQAIKEVLDTAAAAKLVAEDPKDLTGLPEGELRDRLAEIHLPLR